MLTIEQVKVFTLSPAVVRLIAEIKTARLKEARVKAHVASYIEPAFSAFEPFHRSLSPRDPRNGERITSARDLYLAGTEQNEQRARWYALCDQLHAQHGYAGLTPGQCPALIQVKVPVPDRLFGDRDRYFAAAALDGRIVTVIVAAMDWERHASDRSATPARPPRRSNADASS